MGDGADLGLQAKQRRLPAINGAEGEGGTDEGEEKPAEVGGRMDLGCLDLGRLDLVYPSPRTVEQMREGLDLSHLPSPVEEMSRAGAGLLLAEKGRGAPVQERERERRRDWRGRVDGSGRCSLGAVIGSSVGPMPSTTLFLGQLSDARTTFISGRREYFVI
jgi:hypothetical protein